MPASSAIPYWRLAGFYFFYFAALGAFLPYWALYLQAKGYGAEAIGQLMALLAATKLVSPNLCGWLADRSDRSVLLIRISSCLTAVSFALLERFPGFAWMASITAAFGLFWNAPLPLFEAVTLGYLHRDAHRYSRIRVWGSIGFITAVLSLGAALKSVLLIDCLPQVIFLLLVGMGLTTLTVPERTIGGAHGEPASLWAILKQPGVLAFFAVVMLVQLAHGPYYVFFSIYLQDNGYDSGQTGLLWSLGVLAEILLFLFFSGLLRRYSARRILLASILLGMVRWLLIAWFVRDATVIACAQMLHAASFGATHVVAVQLVQRYFGRGQHGTGQSLYSSLSYGLGGVLGSYYSGMLWVPLGATWVYSLAAGASLLAALIVWIGVERTSDRGGGPGCRESVSRRPA
ncbi:MAG: transporter [Proteobacteria bacterium]|nr:transporter [Pseudomonadota bacterium]